MRPAQFWDITQPMVAIPQRRFGTTYESHLKGQDIQGEFRYLLTTHQKTKQTSNQPIKRHTDQPTYRPVARTTDQSNIQPTNHPTKLPTSHTIKQSTDQPNDQTVATCAKGQVTVTKSV